jgi:hypothetical protein
MLHPSAWSVFQTSQQGKQPTVINLFDDDESSELA